MGQLIINPSTSKDVKTNSATWTSDFTTNSATLVDVTNATVTISSLSAAKTYDIIAIFSGGSLLNNSGMSSSIALLIDSTKSGNTTIDGTNANSLNTVALAGRKQVTGATSYTAKLQMLTQAGSVGALYNAGVGGGNLSQLTIMAVEV